MSPEHDECELSVVMAGVVVRDQVAIGRFFHIARRPLRAIVLARFQEAGFWVPADRIADIVDDLVLELIDLAPRWRPEVGAPPWAWARRRLVASAFARLGVVGVELDELVSVADETQDPAVHTEACGADDPMELLDGVADSRTEAALLARALRARVSERDRAVWLEVLLEQGSGNRSPAVTVAQIHGLSPLLVRKICQRVRDRLCGLCRADPRFEPLLGLRALAA